MDHALIDVFEQARQVVADEDRKIAEEEQRRREIERERLLLDLGPLIEDAFDFTSKEKLELEPRLDVQGGVAVVELVVRSVRAIFLLSHGEGNTWTLQVLEDGHGPQVLSEFQGGTKAEQASRRLAAARIVTAIGNWVQNVRGVQSVQSVQEPQVVPNTNQPPRLHHRNVPKSEPTYGTMGKFLGVRG